MKKQFNADNTSAIKVFEHAMFGAIRTAVCNCEPMFCLSDVCKALGLSNSSMVKRRLNQWGISMIDTPTSSGIQVMTFINEENLYQCVTRSDKPEAQEFRHWVFGTVLPSIRKTGAYVHAPAVETADVPADLAQTARIRGLLCQNVSLINELAAELECAQNCVRLLEEKVEADRPAVELGRLFMESDVACTVGEYAKVLTQLGYTIGRNSLYATLREEGYLCSTGEARNQPVQRYMEQGLFRMKRHLYIDDDGMPHVRTTTLITPKGQSHLYQKFFGRGHQPAVALPAPIAPKDPSGQAAASAPTEPSSPWETDNRPEHSLTEDTAPLSAPCSTNEETAVAALRTAIYFY